jgi:adenosylcobinamide-GDP ribazoletransferase
MEEPSATAAAPAPEPAAPWWASLALGWSFLTVLPAPPAPATPATLARAAGWFPLVGGLLGAALGGLGLLLDYVLPPGPVAVALLAAGALLTGGLHLDGLMDTADGLGGGRTPERRLEIMRDSRVGAFGVIAGALALLGQYACLTGLIGLPRLLALAAAGALSRWAMTLALGRFPSARSGGLGASLRAQGSRAAQVVAALLALTAALLTAPLGLVGLPLAAAVALLGGRWLTRRLGGLTGDTYGALAVVTETAILLLAAGWWST